MTEVQQKSKDAHLGYLDAARGIAALMVLFYHYIGWKYESNILVKSAAIVFNGSDAVSFFFVLSGFVLSYKTIVWNQPLDIGRFYVARFFRLFPAFFITIVIGTLYWERHSLNLEMFKDVFILNKREFWEEAFLPRDRVRVYGAGWTLAIEMTISFFMPFFIALARYDKRILPWLLAGMMLEGNSMISQFHIHFVLGLILCVYFNELQSPSFKETRWYRYRYPLLAAAFVLFSIRHIDRIWHFGSTYVYVADYLHIDLFLYTGIGSFIFLGWMIYSRPLQKILSHRLLLFFGRISYGVYLAHWVIITAIFDHWDKILEYFGGTKPAFFIMLAVAFALTIIIATLLHYFVELPFISVGKRVAKKLKPGLTIK